MKAFAKESYCYKLFRRLRVYWFIQYQIMVQLHLLYSELEQHFSTAGTGPGSGTKKVVNGTKELLKSKDHGCTF